MRAGAAWFFAVSLSAHLALGVALGTVSAGQRHEAVAITFVEASKPKVRAPLDPPPEPKPPPDTQSHPVRAKAAPPTPKAVPDQTTSSQSTGSGALPDFGLSLTGGGAGGVAVPVGGTDAPGAGPVATVKRLARSATGLDDCTDVAKPKVLSRPNPVYTDEARTLGLSGKVRVEITIDERGRVTSVHLIQGLGHGLDESALAAAREMTFEPSVRCGRPSSATFKVGFNFAPPVP
jgi:periplasmic protein TonB